MNFARRPIGQSGQTARLSFENIRHGYGQGDVVKDVSLSASAGEVLCLLGPSGSGKSTLLRIAAGLELPHQGRLLIDGVEVTGPSVFLPPERRGIGLMFQDFALFPHMTVGDNVAFGLQRLPRAARQTAVSEALARVGLSGYRDKYPHMLSGGEQQRVALARAVAPRPSVLLMDEPFSGLDSRLKDQVRAETLAVLRDTGATVIIVTHDPGEAMGMADRIALLKDGHLVQTGSPRALFCHPQSLFAASFFSEINRFEGKVEAGQVETPFGRRPVAAEVSDGPVTIAVRPGDIRLAQDASLSGQPAEVLERRFLGTAELFRLRIEGTPHVLEASVSAGSIAEGAERVFVEVADQTILVFENR
ncbi:ABC transporter ATP-binding protein [Martelella soudanensis]|uniref:ABC transporter ATP-binding protein n=1 Tax=unclassified Martelella TaxID=2629616 RepID=UPI0015DFF1AE|nr:MULTISPECIES: ABC transporter ATP-binding protein [unclassified Martelella]